jgi:hypothetical protein
MGSVSRHKRIERSESFDDASLQLGQQGCPEPLEREQYRHCTSSQYLAPVGDVDQLNSPVKPALRSGQYLRFGFSGQHTDDFKNDITVENVRRLMRYLGRVTDVQIQNGLTASGATLEEATCFATQLRKRINQLRGRGGRDRRTVKLTDHGFVVWDLAA